MNKVTSFIVLVLCTFTLNTISKEIEKSKKALDFLTACKSKTDGGELWIYEISNNELTDKDVFDVVNRVNRNCINKGIENNKIFYKSNDKKEFLIYDPKKSFYTYRNRNVGYLEKNSQDSTFLRNRADEHFKNILGSKAKDYVFLNNEYDIIRWADAPDKNNIVKITYRYVRKLDNRLLVGGTNYIRITLGGKGELAGFDFEEPILKKLKKLNKVLKYAKIEKYLDKHIESEEYNQIPADAALEWTKVDVKNGAFAYFEEARGDKKVLVPYVSFYSKNNLNGNEIMTFINLTQDAECIPDINTDDFVAQNLIEK
jgi:hypothetical protein